MKTLLVALAIASSLSSVGCVSFNTEKLEADIQRQYEGTTDVPAIAGMQPSEISQLEYGTNITVVEAPVGDAPSKVKSGTYLYQQKRHASAPEPGR